ncbi:hypothetical protein [Sphingobium sp.]|uniref:hypothetical protein n=1 Tax=Sphingobium sp. TaxID=1912891 RepID=UPI002C596663|nr:hypothetical protein [Sphingobium sp.]HUD94545.1 hypothetical protein [Sphingobium sp.]
MTGQGARRITISSRVLQEVRPVAAGAPSPAKSSAETRFPAMRSLRIFAVDTSIRNEVGGIVTISIPFEPLVRKAGGFQGRIFAVRLPKGNQWAQHREILGHMRVNSAANLASQGYAPTLNDPRFIVQMVYGVSSQLFETFRRALGREIVLGLRYDLVRGREHWKRAEHFTLDPWAGEEAQAWYDRDEAMVAFGHFRAQQDTIGYPPGSRVFTALSHDVIVHEMTHALLDAVKPHFIVPTHRDVLAFHEAFADLIAIFQRFSYDELVVQQLAAARADIDRLGILSSLARSFAITSGRGNTLRPLQGDLLYDQVGEEPHMLGNVLVQAVYRAFRMVVERRIAAPIAIATGGTGLLPKGELPPALTAEIAKHVRKTALMFQTMLIRALDYCPPFGISFFTFLRAVISADIRQVPVDEEGIRAVWMEAFRHHRIFPENGLHFADDQLAWRTPWNDEVSQVRMLSFAETAFAGNPGELLSWEAALVQSSKVAQKLGSDEWIARLALDDMPDDLVRSTTEIIGIRSFARPGPDRMTEFGTIVEIVQRNITPRDSSGFMAGMSACLIFDSDGRLASCVRLPVMGGEAGSALDDHRRAIERYSVSTEGARSWLQVNGQWTIRGNIMRRLCAR